MGIEILSRTSKAFYEQHFFLNTIKQFFYTIFGSLDESEEAGFLLDSLVGDPYGITYRDNDSQAHLRKYEAGEGRLIDIPVASDKTPITSSLRDRAIVGLESTAGFRKQEAQLVKNITKQHLSAINMTKNYQAIQVLRTGIFEAKGPKAGSLGLDINFGRKPGNSFTYNFVPAANTMSKALKEAEVKMDAQGTPKQNRCVVMGANWLNEFSEDTVIQEYQKSNDVNKILESPMTPPELLGTEGLVVVATYRAPSMLYPMFICSYTPNKEYVAYKGATPAPFIPSTDAIFFSLSDERFRVNRGMDVLDGNERVIRLAGEIGFDSYTLKDPVGTFLRSKTRHCLVPANINHTFLSVGTFA